MIEVFKQLVEALKISRDQNVDPEYAPIGWNVDRLDEAIQAGRQAIAQLESEKPAAWDSLQKMANNRYKVVSHDSIFHGHAVVAGTGTNPAYIGREVECQNMARKFTNAFLDGAFAYKELVSTPQQRKPLTYEQIAETFCKAPRQTQNAAWFAAGVRYAEAVHGIKE